MRLILCLLLLYYFHSNHKLQALTGGRDPMRSGDPEGPFFAGRGRRGSGLTPLEERLLQSKQSDGDTTDSAGEVNNDIRRFIGSDPETKLRLDWPLTFPFLLERPSMRMTGLSPSSSRHMSIPTMDDRAAYYIWYNIRKKQSNIKSDPDDSPFMAVRG